MLILRRRINESLFIDYDIKVTILRIKGNQVKIGIDALEGVRIEQFNNIYIWSGT